MVGIIFILHFATAVTPHLTYITLDHWMDLHENNETESAIVELTRACSAPSVQENSCAEVCLPFIYMYNNNNNMASCFTFSLSCRTRHTKTNVPHFFCQANYQSNLPISPHKRSYLAGSPKGIADDRGLV